MGKIHWSREATLNLIELYKQLPCLWDVKADIYRDREERASAYNKIVRDLKIDNLTVEEVKRKLGLLRNQHRREMRLITRSMKSGAGKEQVYTPKLWYFDMLSFLNSGDVIRRSVSSLDEDLPNVELYSDSEVSVE